MTDFSHTVGDARKRTVHGLMVDAIHKADLSGLRRELELPVDEPLVWEGDDA